MKEDIFSFYDNPIDSMLMTNEYDEWDHVQYLISEGLKCCDITDDIGPRFLPFIRNFEGKIQDKLVKVGFKKEVIDDPEKLETMLRILDGQGIEYMSPRFEPRFFPEGSFTMREDKRIYWIEPDIDAAIRALKSLSVIRGLLLKDGVLNKDAARVYLRSMELIINLARAGDVPKMAKVEAKKRGNSIASRDIKKIIASRVIIEIFEKYPHRPKTLGEIWNKLNLIAKGKPMTDKQTGKKYYVETGKDKKGEDVLVITGDGIKPSRPLKYKKRSLNKIIYHLRDRFPSSITQ